MGGCTEGKTATRRGWSLPEGWGPTCAIVLTFASSYVVAVGLSAKVYLAVAAAACIYTLWYCARHCQSPLGLDWCTLFPWALVVATVGALYAYFVDPSMGSPYHERIILTHFLAPPCVFFMGWAVFRSARLAYDRALRVIGWLVFSMAAAGLVRALVGIVANPSQLFHRVWWDVFYGNPIPASATMGAALFFPLTGRERLDRRLKVVYILCILLALSRSVMIGTAVALALLGVRRVRNRGGINRRVAIAVICALVVIAPFVLHIMVLRSRSDSVRVLQYICSIDMLSKSSPLQWLLGHGYDHAPIDLIPYLGDRKYTMPDNMYVTVLYEQGVLCLVAVASFPLRAVKLALTGRGSKEVAGQGSSGRRTGLNLDVLYALALVSLFVSAFFYDAHKHMQPSILMALLCSVVASRDEFVFRRRGCARKSRNDQKNGGDAAVEKPTQRQSAAAPKLHTIWIWNHYAIKAFTRHGGRHYYFGKFLQEMGFSPVVFSASSLHGTGTGVEVDGTFKKVTWDGIPLVLVKVRDYSDNGIQRVLNMVDFCRGVKKAAVQVAKTDGAPDIIFASSVHPLTLVAGEKTARKMGIPCVCEVRDLWPECLIAYGYLAEHSPLAKLLYWGEHRIYAKADAVVGTMEGCAQYIRNRGWDMQSGGNVDLRKVFYINNGVDVRDFDQSLETYSVDDPDLDDPSTFKVVYTGSIRTVNGVSYLLDVSEWLDAHGHTDVKFLLYGAGDQIEKLQKNIDERHLSNVVLKGQVERHCVPYVLSRANLLVLGLNDSADTERIYRYGTSMNKSFEYLASGKPIINLYKGAPGYDYIRLSGAGVSRSFSGPDDFAREILNFQQMPKAEYDAYCRNARKAAEEQFDFGILTKKLVSVFEYVIGNRAR